MKKLIKMIQTVIMTISCLFTAHAEPAWDAQWFADAGTLVNTTVRYQNAYDASDYEAFAGANDLSPTMKTFYDTNLLVNSRPKLIYAQLGRKEGLPKNGGRSKELRRINTLGKCTKLTEGVIPTGKKAGMTSVTMNLGQWGDYVAISDLLELHALDNVIAGAVEELGAAGGKTHDLLIRNVLKGGTNILFADAYSGTTYQSTPTTEAELQTALGSYKCDLTPDMINKASVNLEVGGAPKFSGDMYVAVIHPHVAYSVRKHPDFWETHKYCRPEELFKNEIGALHGVRFITSNLAPIIKSDGQTYATYKTLFFGKDAFGVVDPEGSGMETIVKTKEQVGGPLNQFSTVGTKFEVAGKILYQERMVAVWSGSPWSTTDAAN